MNSRNRVLAAGISVLIYALISLLSSLPARSLPTGIPDFIPHGVEFFLLGFFFIQTFSAPRRWPTMAAALLLLAGLGLLDEVHQLAVPGRVFSLLDWAYDLAGALAGLTVFRTIRKSA
jgi:VanZ family protein